MTIVNTANLPKTIRRNDTGGFARLWKDRVAKWERSPAYHAFVEQLKALEEMDPPK